MNNHFDIVGIGAVLIDEMSILEKFPNEDEKVEILITQKQLGGPVPTALMSLSKLGLKTSFISKTGDDTNSDYIRQKLKAADIDITNLIKEVDTKSGHSQIWINSKTGSRTIAYSSGTLSPLAKEELPKDLPSANFLHIDGRNSDIIFKIIKEYKSKGTYISIDTGNYRKKTESLIDYCDIVIMPKRFAAELFKSNSLIDLINQTANKYKDAKLIVITDGKNGSIAMYKNGIYRQNAFPIEAIDTTGAGDVHSSGILFGLYNNLQIQSTLEFAAALAALKCHHLGNIKLADCDEVQKFLKQKETEAII